MQPWMIGIAQHMIPAALGLASGYLAKWHPTGALAEYAPIIAIAVQQVSLHATAYLQAASAQQGK